MKQTIELRCNHDLARRLGAVMPEDREHHKRLRDLGHLVVRDNGACSFSPLPMFWVWLVDPITARSS